MAERLERIERRLKEIEEEMAQAETTTRDVWEGEGGGTWRLEEERMTEEELAKAGELDGMQAGSLRSQDGSRLEAGAPRDEVQAGMPQGIVGQQARHGSARLWEGVL